ncbi:glycosyltransferase [Mycolicibacterium flavescens]|uniref:glycosyltransferase n=1 Tax=Mycolicibacterium flavescens TaxID=1776 RepID=UPI001F2E68D3|nr:glycosyltransferase [Mycolicibacterium flavescens]
MTTAVQANRDDRRVPPRSPKDGVRILQAVTMLSPDGAYGGPVRVALNQAVALRDRGHSVVVAAAQRDYEVVPTRQDGIPLVLRPARRLVPRTGFAGLWAPGLVKWLIGARDEFDVAHVHLGRDLVLLPLTTLLMRMRIPFVLQPHGMILPGAHPLAPLVDGLLVRRLLRAAHEVFYLTSEESDALDEVARGEARLSPLGNGVPLYEPASAVGDVPEVLFLARLHPRKRPIDFVEAAHILNSEGVRAKYTLVGPDEGEGKKVQSAASKADNVRWEGPVGAGEAPARMRRAAMYILPSIGPEPYPMAVLEAMSVGLPIVATEQCGLAALIRKHRCGIIIEPGPRSLARAIRTLINDPGIARTMGARGRAAVINDLGMTPVGQRLAESYLEAALRPRRSA